MDGLPASGDRLADVFDIFHWCGLFALSGEAAFPSLSIDLSHVRLYPGLHLHSEFAIMTLPDKARLALHDLFASCFSLISNLLAVVIGVGFLGLLVSLALGVSQFFENYYTRTMSLTTLLAFYAPETGNVTPFDWNFREQLAKQPGIDHILYHDIDFSSIEMTSGRKADVAVRSAVPQDPEIERLERVAGDNLPNFTDPTQPSVVISLVRAMKLSDSPAAELIGREVAITFNRSLRMEDEPERESVYATISGIVQESPDETIYLPYQMLAAAHAWQRETLTGPVDQSASLTIQPSFPHPPLDTTREPTLVDSDELTVEQLYAEVGLEPAVPITSPLSEVPRIPEGPRFRFPRIADAYSGLVDTLQDDSIIYPHLRIHCHDLDSLLALREKLRQQNIPTTAVLDEIASIRELRRYVLMVFGLIGSITLLAAVCSIFNTLLAAVERRTREIGILRALGASQTDVLTIFLTEGVAIGVIGSLIAAAVIKLLSMSLNQLVLDRLSSDPEFQRLTSLNPSFFAYPLWLPLVVVAVGGLAAFSAALLPALKACSITPVDALRHAG